MHLRTLLDTLHYFLSFILMLKQITPEIKKEEIKSQTGNKSVKNMMDSMGLGMFAGEVHFPFLYG